MENNSHEMIVELDQYLSTEMRSASEALDRITEIQEELIGHNFSADNFKYLCIANGIKWDVLNRMRNVIWRVYDKYKEGVNEDGR